MREIKFRGRTLDEKPVHWVYGYLNNDEGGLYICQPFNAKVYVDPETVGQFTGMEDVSGYQIYEGDVVELQGIMIFTTYFTKSRNWSETFSTTRNFIKNFLKPTIYTRNKFLTERKLQWYILTT